MRREAISTAHAPQMRLPLSQAVRFGDLVFVSGIVGVSPETGEIVGTDLESQTRQVLDNMREILAAAESSLGRVVKTTCFLTDMDDFGDFNRIYSEYFPTSPPARSTFQVGRLAPGFVVEIEAIAVVDV